ncbi:alpha/beta hydrolase family protein [Zavarzinia sp.]|uniref:alpha/beta hydrolase family protein n=1 Tax=Zavarzinia sp. TaxID=2027920 RepID=UPI003568C7D3
MAHWWLPSLALAFGCLTVDAAQADTPLPPTEGPGSPGTAAAEVRQVDGPKGGDGYVLFLPEAPRPETAPVVVFLHGWGAIRPRAYLGWIDHLVRRGNIVIYPYYQDGLATPSADFLGHAAKGIAAALAALPAAGIAPDLDRVAVVGHSAGGMVAAGLGAQAAAFGLPRFSAVMAVQPGNSAKRGSVSIPLADVSTMPAETLLLSVFAADDAMVGDHDARRIYDETVHVPAQNKNLLALVSDHHGRPALVANHFAATAARDRGFLEAGEMGIGRIDALDWYGTWKLFDALTDTAFHDGLNRDVALGGGPKQTYMGRWSDGTPVQPIRVVK